MLKALIFFLSVFLVQAAYAEEFMSLHNFEEAEEETDWEPGTMIVLPGGAVSLVEEELANGDFRCADGSIITREGKVKDSGGEIAILRQPDLEIGARVKLPQGKEDIISEKLADGMFKTKGGLLLSEDGKVHLPITHVESFEEAEEFQANSGQAREKKEGGGNADLDPLAELLAFNNAGEAEAEAQKSEKSGKQSKTAYTARKGAKLAIPPGAAAKKDYSFLKGCWKSKAVTYYDNFTPYKAPAELCFNGGANGSLISYLDGVCKARAKAKFQSGVLLIQAGFGPCSKGRRYSATMPRMFQCDGEAANTECYILAKDNTDKRRKFKSRARFYRK